MSVPNNLDALLAQTLNNYRKTMEDNVFHDMPLTYWLTEKGRSREVNGGAKIQVPLMYAANDTAKVYSGYDTLDITPQDGMSAALFDWRQAAVSVAISGIEEAQNNGEAAILNLLQNKVRQSEMSLTQLFNTQFHAASPGAKDFESIAHIVDSSGSVGGIDPGTYTWWKSTETSVGGPLTVGAMTTLYNTVSKGKDHPDLVLSTQTLYEKYESLLQPQMRFTNTKVADAGFENLTFKGATFMFDPDCISGVLYMLNSKYLELVKHSSNWFRHTPFVVPENQDARYSNIICYGQLTVSNRARHGKLTGATA